MSIPNSEYDQKLRQLIHDIVELRILAAKNGAAYQAEGKLSIARSFESMALALSDNDPFSVQQLAHWAEGRFDLKVTGPATPEEIKKETDSLYRYLRIQGKI